ncbi:MAG: peptide ABC transporter substrate-binding protein [Clostridia bacterium]|nr:peptide ABC transporter substrate-binding protein [Clostridia bacterium]
MKKIAMLMLAAVMVMTCALTAVGCSKEEDKNSISICLASEPASLDPALNSSVDGATMLVHLFSGLVKYDKNLNLVADAAEALPTPTIADNGEATYVFKLRDGMKWSNGETVKASDFEWAWKRAASTALGADYGYMFEVVKGYGDDDVDGLAPIAVTADDAARTLTVVLSVDVPYFYELCAFPAYMPLYNKNNSIDAEGTWATKPETYVCNGAYTISSWEHNQCITLTKNNNYFDAANVTMDEIKCYLSDDAATMLANYKTGDWIFIDDVPNDEIPALKTSYANEFVVGSQLGTYYISFNNNLDLTTAAYKAGKSTEDIAKANIEIREALSLLIDRDYVCVNIGQAGQQPASSFVALGLTDPSNNNEQFYMHAGHSTEYVGYYDATKAANESNNVKAMNILKKYFTLENGKFTDFPTFTYLYNTSSGHKAIAEYIQSAFATYGINITLQNQEWATFLETRKQGQYGVARNGWLGDYNDPISFLDMWITGSGNNDSQFGKYNEVTGTTLIDGSNLAIYSMDLSGIEGYADKSVTNGTWAQTYDVLIGYIKKESNTVKRYQLMHVAEDVLMSTGSIVPIYYYTDIYMCSQKLNGFFSSPLGYKYFMYCTLK